MSNLNPDRRFLLEQIQFDKTVRRARGHYLYDERGNAYLDFLAQYGAVPFGHNASLLWEAIDRVRRNDEPALVQPLISPAAEALGTVLSRISQIAHTSSLRLQVASDEAGVVALGGALRPGRPTKGHSKGHRRTLVKWPTTVLGFRAPGKLYVTIKLSRAARVNLAHSRNARVGIATVAADLRRNQKSDYFKLAVKR